MKLKDLKKILESAPDDTEIKVENGEIVIAEPKPIEYKFKVGDKVRNVEVSEFRYTVKERHSTNRQVVYTLEYEHGGETALNEEYLELASQDITDRIKTFEDAVRWCEENGEANLVNHYDDWEIYNDTSKDILAYLKLRIITCALNEGWEPTFEEDKYGFEIEDRFVPDLDDKDASAIRNDSKYGDSSIKLCFKSFNLAEYAARQFRDIYADFCGCKKGGEK